MDNKENIIILLLTIIVFLNFLIFIKIKTYSIDNFTDNSQLVFQDYSSITSTTNRRIIYYIKQQAFLYSILLKTPLDGSDNVLGLVIFLLCYNFSDSDQHYRPILYQMLKKNQKTIDYFQSTLSAQQKLDIPTPIVIINIASYTRAVTDAEKEKAISDLMLTFASLKQRLDLSIDQLKDINSIIKIWKSSKNSYFTKENFAQFSFSNTTMESDTIEKWQQFFVNCKI